MSDTPSQIETDLHHAIRDHVWAALQSWRRFIIAVDGVDHSGKSTLARYLAWQLGIPAIETDTYLDLNGEPLDVRADDLQRVLASRLDHNRPVIIEGVMVLQTLANISLQPDYIVYLENEDFSGTDSLKDRLTKYQTKHQPRDRADYVFRWRSSD